MWWGSALVGSLVAAACGAPGGGAKPGDQAALPLEQRKATEYEIWIGTTADRTAQVDAWNAKYPNLKMVTTTAPSGQGQKDLEKFTTALAAGSAPPVAYFDRFQVAAFAIRKVFRNLDDLVKTEKYDLKRFVPATMEEAYGPDKKLYAIPANTDVRFLFWNKELFERAGLNPDKAPATWDEFRDYATKLTRRGGETGLTQIGIDPGGATRPHMFIYQNGGVLQSPDGKKATLNDPKNVEAMQFHQELAKVQGGGPTITAYTKTWGGGAQDKFYVGNVAMAMEGDGRLGGIARYRPEMRFGYAAPPVRKAGDKPLSWSGGFCFVMTRDTKDVDVAWKLIQFLVSEEGFRIGYEGRKAKAAATGGFFVPTMSAQPEIDQKMFAKYKTGVPTVDSGLLFAVDLLKYTRIREPSIAADALWDGVINAHLQAVMQEAKTAKQALDDNQVIVQKALDDAWAAVSK